MPTPSLILVPARFKTGKLYTPLATTSGGTVLGASGDFNVTRATTATRVNASGYIESVASGIPRLDYFASGGTAGCPALLVEPAATNLALQSSGFEVSGTWAPTNTSITTGTTAAFTAPDNSTDADLLTSTTSGSLFVGQGIAIASGTYTISVFAKADTSHIFSLGNVSRNLRGAWFNLNAGAVTGTVNGGTASMQNYGNGWYRCIYTSSGMVSGTNTLIVGLADAANGLTATSGTNLYVWGAQLETGSIATSYIPTTTAAVTRNAEVISLSGAVSGCIGQTEGTIYAEVDIANRFANKFVFTISSDQSTVSGRIGLNSNTNNRWRFQINDVSGTATTTSSSNDAQTLGISKVAIAYGNNQDAVLYVNGQSVITATGTSGYVFDFKNLTIGATNTNSSVWNDRIRAVALYTTRLTNAQLAALTT